MCSSQRLRRPKSSPAAFRYCCLLLVFFVSLIAIDTIASTAVVEAATTTLTTTTAKSRRKRSFFRYWNNRNNNADDENNKRQQKEEQQLPVLIVGAGPCGLVAAATLQKHGIPFVIIEKASRSKVCSNAGSGFELAKTAIHVLRDRLSVDTSRIMTQYIGMRVGTMAPQSETLRDARLPRGMTLASVNRAAMQTYLLGEVLFPGGTEEENGVLMCGCGIESYTEEEDGRVVLTLVSRGEDGNGKKKTTTKTIAGCALLACDGINSKTREIMHGGSNGNDPLRFGGSVFYWGKTPVPEGSELETEFRKTQSFREDGCSFVVALRTTRSPGGMFVVPTNNSTVLVWAVCVSTTTSTQNNDGSSKKLTQNNNDSTRRGGAVLTEEGKERIFRASPTNEILGEGSNLPLLRKIIEITPGKDITEAYLYDRENLDLPFSSPGKRVALLGDAAHPQTPFLGQGVNTAIADGYICATRIAMALKNKQQQQNDGDDGIPSAIASYDTDHRRDQIKKIVLLARSYQNMMLSPNPFVCWFLKWYMRLAPNSEFTGQVDGFDRSNKEFLQALDDDHTPEEQQQRRLLAG